MKLKEILEERNISVADFATQIGITRQALYYKMNGERKFTFEEAKKIQDILGLSEEELRIALER